MKTLIIFLLVVVTIFSCTTSRDNRAVVRVLSKNDLSEKVGKVWEKSHPCITDVKFIHGKDSIIIDSFAAENIAFLNGVIDSLLLIHCKTEEGHSVFNLDSLKNKIRIEVEKNCKPEYHLRIDTFIQKDDRRLGLCQDEIIVLRTQLKASQDSDTAHKKGKLHWILASIGLFIILALVIYIGLKK